MKPYFDSDSTIDGECYCTGLEHDLLHYKTSEKMKVFYTAFGMYAISFCMFLTELTLKARIL